MNIILYKIKSASPKSNFIFVNFCVEYGTSEWISMQGDVYSYGIILLEMFTNKRPTDDLFGDDMNLQRFVSSALPHGVMEIVDPQIQTGGALEMECITRVLKIGVSCSNEIPRDRMPITHVVDELSDILKVWFRN